MDQELQIQTPKWCLPLFNKSRYKGAKGGRGSGKSHLLAEMAVEASIMDKELQVVCIREIQKSLKHSAKKLIEDKIRQFNVQHLYDITLSEIRRVDGEGLFIFQGMQDHTADSIKSIEGFGLAWVEEAQSLSARSMELLLPTIRCADSELWFSWNPENEDDPVEVLFADHENDDDMICVHVNYMDNPFLPDELRKEAIRHQRFRPDTFAHVWLGEFNTKSESQVFNGKYEVQEFEPDETFGDPLHGMDFGFAQDPTTAVRVYAANGNLYINYESSEVGLELDDTSNRIKKDIPDIEKYVIRADSARPESISYLSRHGLPHMQSVKKWPGSVEDGVEFMKSFEKIIIHPRCTETIQEFRKYSYKVDKRTGDILPQIVDKWNHLVDSIRYAISPLIKARQDTALVGNAEDIPNPDNAEIGSTQTVETDGMGVF